MNLDRGLARSLAGGLCEALAAHSTVDVGVFPPFTLLADIVGVAERTDLIVGAQNCHQEVSGAYTGEVSADMVRDTGATHVILGHSERRRDFGETEEVLAKKIESALDHGLKPIYCVGETLAERDAGRTLEVVLGQVRDALSSFGVSDLRELTVAYEPVWAIGTGRTATPEQAVEVHHAIRMCCGEMFNGDFADNLRIQYGGSVNADNAASLFGEAEIDGGLVGGASLKLESFLAIIDEARA